jgi:Aminoarabinose transferase C-terminal domain
LPATLVAATSDSVLTAPLRGRRIFWIGFALVLLALWFVKLPGRPLAHPDEGRYAEISREMVATGDWVTPRINGFAYLLEPGIRAAPELQVPTLEALRARWLANPTAFVIMPPDTFEALQRDGFSAVVIAEDRKTVLVRKPPA